MRHGLKILPRVTPLERIQIIVRAHLCSHCPYQSREREVANIDLPRSCEASCKLFRQLPDLVQMALCVDPLLGSIEHMLDTRIREICEAMPPSSEGKRNFFLMQRPELISDIAKITQAKLHEDLEHRPGRE